MKSFTYAAPSKFVRSSFLDQWFPWSRVEKCFWPGQGKRSDKIDPDLSTIRHKGGIYCLAWSKFAPSKRSPHDQSIRYIGQTSNFSRRMAQFGASAGFWGKRSFGHSAGWRWKKGKTESLWVCFFAVDENIPDHLVAGLRCWLEALALEEYRTKWGKLPDVNDRQSITQLS